MTFVHHRMLKGHCSLFSKSKSDDTLKASKAKNTGSSELNAISSSFKTFSKNSTLMMRLKLLILSSVSFKLVISMRLCPRSLRGFSWNIEKRFWVFLERWAINLNLFAMSANIKSFLCRNKENLIMKDRTSVNISKNNAVSGFNNSSLNLLTSWSAPFSNIFFYYSSITHLNRKFTVTRHYIVWCVWESTSKNLRQI